MSEDNEFKEVTVRAKAKSLRRGQISIGPAEEVGAEVVFSWIEQNRRLSKNYEMLTATSGAFIRLHREL